LQGILPCKEKGMDVKAAFTMVELIFVIVILGILVAVAMPRLSATRDDAEISTMSQAVSIAASEIAAYAVANGNIPNDLTVASNTFLILERQGKVVLSPKKAMIKIGKITDCIIVEINTTVNEEILYVNFGSNQNDALCKPLQMKFSIENYPMKLRGQSVKY